MLLQLDMKGFNNVVYFGLFEGHHPSPSKDPGYIIMSSFLVFYKWIERRTLSELKEIQRSKQAKARLDFYLFSPLLWLRPLLSPQRMHWIQQLTVRADADTCHPRRPLASLFPRRRREVNKKEQQSRRSTRQEEHCSHSRPCAVITCNHVQRESSSCWEVIKCFHLFLDQWPLCWLFTRSKLLLTLTPSASFWPISMYSILWIKKVFFLNMWA